MSDNKEKDKELIAYIAEKLREHELPYKQGAWENFSSGQKKPLRAVLWPYASVAAVLLLVAGLYWFRTPAIHGPETANATAETAFAPGQPAGAPEQPGTVTSGSVEPVAAAKRQKDSDVRPAVGVITRTPPAIVESASFASTPEPVADTSAPVSDQAPSVIAIAEEQPVIPQETGQPAVSDEDRFLQLLRREQQIAGQSTSSSGHSRAAMKKWDVGLVLAPAANEQQMQLSGGVSFAYRLTDRISVGSGVSIAQLGVERAPVLAGGMPPQASSPGPQGPQASPSFESAVEGVKNMAPADRLVENKVLESVRTQVVGLDIPLDFRFHIHPRFYASAGASFFAVLNEERTNNYTKQMSRMADVADKFGQSSMQPVVETQHVSEAAGDQPLSSSGYNGFINLSVGHRLPLSRRFGISLEPFYKLPVGRLAGQDVNLSYGGMRVTAGF